MAVAQINFYSRALNRNTTFQAVLPIDNPKGPAPDGEPARPMAALYLLHGLTGDDLDWLQFTGIRLFAETYNIAVFMPSGSNSFYLDDEEKGERFGEFVGRELVEYTRRLFPLAADRERTWIGGLSMGGYGAIRNGLKYADTFSRIIALSSALVTYRIHGQKEGTVDGHNISYFRRVFGDLDRVLGSDKDPEALVLERKAKGGILPDIYMACGTEDFLLDVNRRFHDFLVKEGVPHTYVEAPGDHNWEFWSTFIRAGLQWAMGKSANP